MFSKDSKTKDAVRKRRHAPPTIISSDLRVTGDVTSEGEIQIDGVVEGDVTGDKLSIGQSGRIKGAVSADKILVRGRITGQIRSRMVTLTSTARVKGDILHETLAIEPGAQLEGHCRPIEPGAQGAEANINLVVNKDAPPRPGG